MLSRLLDRLIGRHSRGAAEGRVPADCRLTLDEAVRVELPERTVLICGAPRSGTSLLSAALFQPPGIVTCMEPWDGLRMAPGLLARSLRREVESGRLSRGRLDHRALLRLGDVRWCPEGDGEVGLGHGAGSGWIGIKWPCYWQLLGRLRGARFLVCTRERHAVAESMRVRGGRLGQGLDYDLPFNVELHRELSRARGDGLRRLAHASMAAERLAQCVADPLVHEVPYERWFEDPEGQMMDIGSFLDLKLNLGSVRIRLPRTAPKPGRAAPGGGRP